MHRGLVRVGLAAALVGGLATAPVLAGGNLESYDVTAGTPSPIAGHVVGKVIPIVWDARCMPIPYRVNNTLDPIPNPLGAPFLTVANATTTLQKSLDSWNKIKTSYVDMRIVGNVANPGFAGFDMVNELTFRSPSSFGAIAVSPSVNFIQDVTLVDGDDIDGDGDSDVSSTVTRCGDADADGDVEFPPGFYKAGTIVENDIVFNTKATGYRFTTADADIDTNTRSVDLEVIAVHESGHSHGLSHVLINQVSRTNGRGATMFPFVNTGEPASELAQRLLEEDDIAWSSYFYPEGTAASGPAALQFGDIPFHLAYGLIKGSVTHGNQNQPLAGAVVQASGVTGSQRIFSSTYSGTTQVSVNPATGGAFLVNQAFNIVDGKYVLPVKLGLWNVGIEAVDGQPVSAGSINTTVVIGNLFAQQNFNEEFFNLGEGNLETSSGSALPIIALPILNTTGVNLTTNSEISISNFGNLNFVGFTGVSPGFYYAVRVPASQITAAATAAGGDLLFHAMQFHTIINDSSVIPAFAEATLAKGTVSGSTATIDLANPLARETNFVGQDNDFAPSYFKFPSTLGQTVQNGIADGSITDLFLVLRLSTAPLPFPGVSALPPFIGLDGGVAANDVPIFGLSYTSSDGLTFNQSTTFNFRFSLVLSKKPAA